MDKFVNIISEYSLFIDKEMGGLDGQTVYDQNILPYKKEEILLAAENILVFSEKELPEDYVTGLQVLIPDLAYF